MEREYVLEALLALVGGTTMLALGWWPPRQGSEVAGWSRERTAWRQIWLPLLPTALVMAWLCGWALAEPDPVKQAKLGSLYKEMIRSQRGDDCSTFLGFGTLSEFAAACPPPK